MLKIGRNKEIFKIKIRRKEVKITLNPLSTNPTKWPNTLKQLVRNLLTNCFSEFDHFVGLALKGLTLKSKIKAETVFSDVDVTAITMGHG